MDDDVVLRIADLSSRANLAGADLSGVYLTNADLSDPRAAPLTGGQDLRRDDDYAARRQGWRDVLRRSLSR